MLFSLEDVKFGGDGLVPVIVQDVLSGEVLMMAWANREALEATLSSGMLTFWSRSRNELWKKGETSGNTLSLQELRLDCDGDALLALAEPAGPACHTGERSCFHRLLTLRGRGTFPGVFGDTWRNGVMTPRRKLRRGFCRVCGGGAEDRKSRTAWPLRPETGRRRYARLRTFSIISRRPCSLQA